MQSAWEQYNSISKAQVLVIMLGAETHSQDPGGGWGTIWYPEVIISSKENEHQSSPDCRFPDDGSVLVLSY